MLNYTALLVLGAIAGFTIYFGLAFSKVSVMKAQSRLMMSAVAAGILTFLIFDVLQGSWSVVEDSFITSISAGTSLNNPILYLAVFMIGLSLGSIGLSAYERVFIASMARKSSKHDENTILGNSSYRLALMIAIGIGAHNFGEGLAIGQSYSSGAIALALVLVIGFGLHNSTEGFGICGPLVRESGTPRTSFLILAGLIGGGPTFLGTVIGSFWVSEIAKVLFLSFAAGALIYVTFTMYRSIASQMSGNRIFVGLFIGVALGFLTDLVVTIGGV
ncbi:hypothetical protein IX51_08710 [uncultured archaeon]|nr:hypothetical protein IX51_08710 [uncultured archaeon]HKJ96978.1 ZIP family metal transporter [Thermoplasmataceae archaeon]